LSGAFGYKSGLNQFTGVYGAPNAENYMNNMISVSPEDLIAQKFAFGMRNNKLYISEQGTDKWYSTGYDFIDGKYVQNTDQNVGDAWFHGEMKQILPTLPDAMTFKFGETGYWSAPGRDIGTQYIQGAIAAALFNSANDNDIGRVLIQAYLQNNDDTVKEIADDYINALFSIATIRQKIIELAGYNENDQQSLNVAFAE